MKTMMRTIAGCAGLAMLAVSASAAPMIQWQDGSAGHEYIGWTQEVFHVSAGLPLPTDPIVIDPNANLDSRDVLSISADTISDGVDFTAAIFATDWFGDPSANLSAYGPNAMEVAGLEFSFYASSGAPAGLGFFFESLGNYWFYDINPLSINSSGWQTFSAPFVGSGWTGYAGGDLGGMPQSLTSADLITVDRLGLYIIFQPNQDGQEYGFAEYGLTVPEPETYVVLGMALLSVAFIFRKKITDSLAEARAMIQM